VLVVGAVVARSRGPLLASPLFGVRFVTERHMSMLEILQALDSEIENLEAARSLLSDHSTVKHNVSPEGRARIAEAVRKRWEREREASKAQE
jgi:hypothetical protein